jgi:uncharacterized membrane protein
MHANLAWLLAFGVGVISGLRAMTAPAVTAWAAHLGWLNLKGSALAFMGSMWSVAILTLAAAAELVADQLPTTPARTKPGPLGARIVMGGLCGACVSVAAGNAAWLGAVLGGVGGVVGAFAGYQARVGLVRGLRVRDAAIAIPEDLVAIGIGLLIVSRVVRVF